MEIIASYYTDAGNSKTINQDSLSVKIVNSPHGKIAFAVICDGMGGLEQGELASKEVIVAFNDWFSTRFATLVATNKVSEDLIYDQWKEQIEEVNNKLAQYSAEMNVVLGTTLTALLIYQNQFFLCHVGDSRIYKVSSELQKLTVDHTLVAQEVRMGKITAEQAKGDPRRSILLQCVGASAVIEPQMDSGGVKENTTFILCSDGLIHKVAEEELYSRFCPDGLENKEQIASACKEMTNLAMSRGERDNITVIGMVVKM